MRAFLVACLAVIVIGAGGYFFLNAMQEPTGVAYTTDGARIRHELVLAIRVHLHQCKRTSHKSSAGRSVRHAQNMAVVFRRLRKAGRRISQVLYIAVGNIVSAGKLLRWWRTPPPLLRSIDHWECQGNQTMRAPTETVQMG